MSVAGLLRGGIHVAVCVSMLVAWLAYSGGSPLWLVFAKAYLCLFALGALLALVFRMIVPIAGDAESNTEQSLSREAN